MPNPFDQFDAAPAGGNPFDQFDAAPAAATVTAQQPAATPAQPGRMSQIFNNALAGHPLLSAYVGMGENALSGATAGVGSLADALTGADPGAHNWAYQPRTPAGQIIGKMAGILPAQAGKGYDAAFGTGPLASTLKERLPEALGAVGTIAGAAGLARGGLVPKAGIATDAGIDRLAQIKEARDAGYKLPPRVGGGVIGSAAEGLSGSAKLERGISVANQKVTNGLAREAIGLNGNAPISAAEINALRKTHNQAYTDLSKSGNVVADENFARDMFSVGDRTSSMMKDFPEAASPAIEKLRNAYLAPEFDASSAVQAVRKLRADAKKYMKAFDDPDKQALGVASRQIADAFDGMLERHAEVVEDPKLAANFQNARQQLAKIHSVEDALNESTGNVNAAALGKQLDRGVPLSGGLKTIAETSRRFGKAVQDVDKLPARSLDYGDAALGVLGTGGAYFTNPVGGVALAALRPATRALLQSELYQNQLGAAGDGSANALLLGGGIGVGAGLMNPRSPQR